PPGRASRRGGAREICPGRAGPEAPEGPQKVWAVWVPPVARALAEAESVPVAPVQLSSWTSTTAAFSPTFEEASCSTEPEIAVTFVAEAAAAKESAAVVTTAASRGACVMLFSRPGAMEGALYVAPS